MAHHRMIKTSGIAASALTCAVCAVGLFGCSEDAPPPPPPPPVEPPPPPPPPKPSVTPVAELMKELNISSKIRLPEDKAPATDPERVAVLKFFDAFAKSNPEGAKAAMSDVDRGILESMEKSGAFKTATQGIDSIRLATGEVSGKPYVVAVFVTGSLYEPQLWAYAVEGESRTIKSQTFDSYAQLPNMQSRFSGTNLIPDWIKIIDAERAEANKGDEVFQIVARTTKDEKEPGEAGAAGNGPVRAPPMRRAPPSKPMKPPDFKPGGN